MEPHFNLRPFMEERYLPDEGFDALCVCFSVQHPTMDPEDFHLLPVQRVPFCQCLQACSLIV